MPYRYGFAHPFDRIEISNTLRLISGKPAILTASPKAGQSFAHHWTLPVTAVLFRRYRCRSGVDLQFLTLSALKHYRPKKLN